MILYFTGTGNSRLVAEYLSQLINDELVSLNKVLKDELPQEFNSERPFIIVAPIYAWRLPLIIEDLLKAATFNGSKDFYFVATMAGNSGRAWKYCQAICQKQGWNFLGFQGVKMPNNCFPMTGEKTDKNNQVVIDKALPVIKTIAETITKSGRLQKNNFSFMQFSKSGWINTMFYKTMVTSKYYRVYHNCNGCGLCAKKCPVNNIEIVDDHPQFGKKCLTCMACLNYCPQKALSFGPASAKIGQYTCPPLKNFLPNSED